jgi:hypothetical protein
VVEIDHLGAIFIGSVVDGEPRGCHKQWLEVVDLPQFPSTGVGSPSMGISSIAWLVSRWDVVVKLAPGATVEAARSFVVVVRIWPEL